MLKQPFILTLLLLPFSVVAFILLDMIVVFLRMQPSIWVIPIVCIIAALYVGRIYASIYKEELSKNHRIRIILYYFVTVLAIFSVYLAIVCEVRSVSQLELFISGAIVPIVLIAAFCMYPSLDLGSRMELKLLEKKTK